MKTVVITGADRGFGYSLTQAFLKKGWRVCAGRFMSSWNELSELQKEYQEQLIVLPLDVSDTSSVNAMYETLAKRVDCIEMVINNAGISAGEANIGDLIEYNKILNAYNVNATGALRVSEIFLPLLQAGQLRRICFVSSEASSISLTTRQRNFGYSMTKSAMNMVAQILFTRLCNDGYTFRIFHPGWMNSYMNNVKGTEGDLEPEESAKVAVSYFINAQGDESQLELLDYHLRVLPF